MTVAPRQSRASMLRGIDHVAIGTDDMAATLLFYTRVMGFHLVHTMRALPLADDDHQLVSTSERRTARDFRRPPGAPKFDNILHFVLDAGNDTLLAIFEYPQGTPRAERDTVGGLQHIAFHADRRAFDEAIARLDRYGVEYLGPFALRDGHTTVNLFDPSGVRLEIVTDWDNDEYSSVDLIRQTADELRVELKTVFDDDQVIDELSIAARAAQQDIDVIPAGARST